MAATELTPVKCTLNASVAQPTLSANDATDGSFFVPNGGDQKLIILAQNTTSGGGAATIDVCVKGGVGVEAMTDTIMEVATGKTGVICIDSGRYTQADGKIKLTAYAHGTTTGSAAISFGVVYHA